MKRAFLGLLLIGCGHTDSTPGTTDDALPTSPDACVGLQCQVVDCAAMSAPPTTISGTVFAPNGTLPLWNVNVYVPNDPVGAFPDGAQCTRCNEQLPGNPVVSAVTDEAGHFTLTNVPAGQNIPLVISIGKWRRQITIPAVNQCSDNAIAATDARLPKNRSEGDIPKIALSTGNADALECLIRKLGVEDGEINTKGSDARIHLYSDLDSGDGRGVSKMAGATFANSKELWNSVDTLKPYDIVILSCEGGQFPDTKSQDAMNAMKAYADLGGRVFASHWHNVWIEGDTGAGGNGQKPAVWTGTATFDDRNQTLPNGTKDLVDVATGHGTSFAQWLVNVGASPMAGQIPLQNNTGKSTATGVLGDTERWTYIDENGTQRPQNFQFTTPYEAPAGERCGKVVFSDMHVSGDSNSDPNDTFPAGCSNADLTPQEKALAFMFFDIASCISVIL